MCCRKHVLGFTASLKDEALFCTAITKLVFYRLTRKVYEKNDCMVDHSTLRSRP